VLHGEMHGNIVFNTLQIWGYHGTITSVAFYYCGASSKIPP
jgi:hypothetical protein